MKVWHVTHAQRGPGSICGNRNRRQNFEAGRPVPSDRLEYFAHRAAGGLLLRQRTSPHLDLRNIQDPSEVVLIDAATAIASSTVPR